MFMIGLDLYRISVCNTANARKSNNTKRWHNMQARLRRPIRCRPTLESDDADVGLSVAKSTEHTVDASSEQ